MARVQAPASVTMSLPFVFAALGSLPCCVCSIRAHTDSDGRARSIYAYRGNGRHRAYTAVKLVAADPLGFRRRRR